ncbi:MAG TPA: hypothetical protein VGR88_02030, partial [Ktedonobacterales bacterium]|nr:hypothetical protein [Ktedonobacterales bacterium]
MPQYPPQSQQTYPPPNQPQYPSQYPSPYPPQYPTYPPQSQPQFPGQYPPPSQPAYPPQGQPTYPGQPSAPPMTLPPSNTSHGSLGLTLGLTATGMTVVAALLVVAVLTYRLGHSHLPSSQLPRWVNGLPPVASALSFLALGVQLVASRVSRAQRKRLEAVYTAAGATAAGSDLPTWLSWLRPGCAPVASASAQVLTVIVLVASVGTTIAGASITSRLASISPRATATATAMATATATPTPTGPHGQQTYTITDPALREANAITAAPDGSLWWSGQGAFGHLVAGGAMTSIPDPSAWSTGRFGDAMFAAPDGNLWF